MKFVIAWIITTALAAFCISYSTHILFNMKLTFTGLFILIIGARAAYLAIKGE